MQILFPQYEAYMYNNKREYRATLTEIDLKADSEGTRVDTRGGLGNELFKAKTIIVENVSYTSDQAVYVSINNRSYMVPAHAIGTFLLEDADYVEFFTGPAVEYLVDIILTNKTGPNNNVAAFVTILN